MGARRSVTISLSRELHAIVERMPASGRYGNLSDVARAAPGPLGEGASRFDGRRTDRSVVADEGIARV